MTLEYIGNGGHITGLPAQDLSEQDVKDYASLIGLTVTQCKKALLKSGLYAEPVAPPLPDTDNTEDDD